MLLEPLRYCPVTARLAVLTVFMLASTPAEGGQEWTCKKSGLVRKLIVKAEVLGESPCTIVYAKPTEKQADKVIGAAKVDFTFCERKAEEVALKLQNSDWDCEREDS